MMLLTWFPYQLKKLLGTGPFLDKERDFGSEDMMQSALMVQTQETKTFAKSNHF